MVSQVAFGVLFLGSCLAAFCYLCRRAPLIDFQYEDFEVADYKTQAIIRGRQHRDALATLADEYARLFGYEPGQCQYEALCRVILDGEDPSEALAAARNIDKAIEEMTDMSGDEMTPGPFG